MYDIHEFLKYINLFSNSLYAYDSLDCRNDQYLSFLKIQMSPGINFIFIKIDNDAIS